MSIADSDDLGALVHLGANVIVDARVLTRDDLLIMVQAARATRGGHVTVRNADSLTQADRVILAQTAAVGRVTFDF